MSGWLGRYEYTFTVLCDLLSERFFTLFPDDTNELDAIAYLFTQGHDIRYFHLPPTFAGSKKTLCRRYGTSVNPPGPGSEHCICGESRYSYPGHSRRNWPQNVKHLNNTQDGDEQPGLTSQPRPLL